MSVREIITWNTSDSYIIRVDEKCDRIPAEQKKRGVYNVTVTGDNAL